MAMLEPFLLVLLIRLVRQEGSGLRSEMLHTCIAPDDVHDPLVSVL
jgi:hypothetical protein